MLRSRRTALQPAAAALAGLLDPLTARVREPEIAWIAARPGFAIDPPAAGAASLVAAARASLATRADADRRTADLVAFAGDANGHELHEVLTRHLRATATSTWRLWGDLRALKRDLDLDALVEREATAVEASGARLEVAVRALGALVVAGLDGDAFERSGAEGVLCDVASQERRLPTRRAAVLALADAVAALVSRDADTGPRGLQVLQRIVRSDQEDPWSRRAALRVTLGLEPGTARRWLEQALSSMDGREPYLLRARAMELLLDGDADNALAVASRHLDDPAELVLFELADGLGRRFHRGDLAAGDLLDRLATEGPARVRARAVAAAGHLGLPRIAPRLLDVPLVAQFALDVVVAAARRGDALPDDVVADLDHLASTAAPGLARRASLGLLASAVPSEDRALAADLAKLRPGDQRRVALPPGAEPEDLARALVPHAADNHGFWLHPTRRGVVVTRGEVRRAKLWRILHELRNPGPTKRQTISHALGRADLGRLRVPPGKLADESATGVPGERLRVGREDGWAPGLPLVDDYLHALEGAPVTVVAPEGTTTIEPPPGILARIRARFRMNIRYAQYDELRVSCMAEPDPALRGRYIGELKQLGFATRTTASSTGPWGAYFAVAIIDPFTYALSMRSNNLTHLSVIVLVYLLFLFLRVSVERTTIVAARERVPLVLGGWGTRGKSGTERLKAGMLEGLGVPILSKTTGCEAMVLHAPPGGHAVELFLFRPYDRATIWEQGDVVRMAPALDARAILYECMALNPLYVDLLQTRWMRDDLSTLTNAYPDHEDVMGPSGTDVARAIGSFSPREATVFTTEDNMRAELEEVAVERGSKLVQISRVDRELVAIELLDRMPHVEHSSNAALAASVGRALGVPWVEALGLMGEHVVPDLGALSVSPSARHMGRDVIFANGMSANDTLSFRHNWRQVGNLAHDHRQDPGTWLVTVINNRADRVARSRVFAQVCVEDAAAHRQVLIGTNTGGFMKYVEESVARKLAGTALGTPDKVDALFAHLRIVDAARLGESCAARLGGPPDIAYGWMEAVGLLPGGPPSLAAAREHVASLRPIAAVLEAACKDGAGLADALVEAAARQVAVAAVRDAAKDAIEALYLELTLASFVVISDPGSTGDQTMAKAILACPPGARVRIMGVQNIKGTGLDFAYQWVYWRELQKGLVELLTEDPERQRRGIAVVEANPFGSALACDEALYTLPAVAADPGIGARVRRQLVRIDQKRTDLLAARSRSGTPSTSGGWRTRLRGVLERFLDPFDAIWRRRRARLVFRDLVQQRISHPRAQQWLQQLTKRQKGGWIGTGRGLH